MVFTDYCNHLGTTYQTLKYRWSNGMTFEAVKKNNIDRFVNEKNELIKEYEAEQEKITKKLNELRR